jgi:acyl-CoA synthetase (AMP-forming)/AMP-acid ligase II
VVYSHRGAYLNTIATVLAYDITPMPTYLWTVPMFHWNGWHLPWGVAMQGGTNVCLRHFTAKVIFDSIARHGVTHMGGAPTVLNMIINTPAMDRRPLPRTIRVMTGGAPPPPHVLFRMEELGFVVYHAYGLTETYGPTTICTWKPEWDALPAEERALLKARQGFHHIVDTFYCCTPVTFHCKRFYLVYWLFLIARIGSVRAQPPLPTTPSPSYMFPCNQTLDIDHNTTTLSFSSHPRVQSAAGWLARSSKPVHPSHQLISVAGAIADVC